ncbi:hypothetical protein AU476_03780 [Cupriavidus sp. UYMSc13B]|nr:hypothetical protein AU476_03780 [Cupriavidus sp. UYMSc13B]
MLAELDPKPDQMTVAINTTQMNIMELLYREYLEGTSLSHPAYVAAYSEMTVPAGPAWVEEHLRLPVVISKTAVFACCGRTDHR